MTDLQKQRAQVILAERKELEENDIIDLVLDFWQEANLCYRKKISHITGIIWKKENKIWECRIADAYRKMAVSIYDCEYYSQGKERLKELQQELREIGPDSIFRKQDEFSEMGFNLYRDSSTMIMNLATKTKNSQV